VFTLKLCGAETYFLRYHLASPQLGAKKTKNGVDCSFARIYSFYGESMWLQSLRMSNFLRKALVAQVPPPLCMKNLRLLPPTIRTKQSIYQQ